MSEILACPDCGETKFSWALQQIQFGIMHEYENGSRDGEGTKMGPVIDSDIHTDGPYCTGCDGHKDVDDLVITDD